MTVLTDPDTVDVQCPDFRSLEAAATTTTTFESVGTQTVLNYLVHTGTQADGPLPALFDETNRAALKLFKKEADLIIRKFTALTIEGPVEARMALDSLLAKVTATITSVRRIINAYVIAEVPVGARAAVKSKLRQQTSAYLVPLCNRVDRLRLMTAFPQNIDFSEVMADLHELQTLIEIKPEL